MHRAGGFSNALQHSGEPVKRSYRMKLWWLGLDHLDRVSVICSAGLIAAAFWALAFALGIGK